MGAICVYLLSVLFKTNVALEWFAVLLRILEVLGSDLVLETGCPEVFRSSHQSLQASANGALNKPRSFTAVSLPIHHAQSSHYSMLRNQST